MDLYYIRWLDSQSIVNSTVWITKEELNDTKFDNSFCITVGYIVKETDINLIVSSTYSEDGDQNITEYSGIISIPKAVVLDKVCLTSCIQRNNPENNND